MRALAVLVALAAPLAAEVRVAALPGASPVISFRIVFTTGSASDSADKPGAAYLTAMMLANGGSREKTYQQMVDAMYPMAASFRAQVDKEMTTFAGETHADNLTGYYALLRGALLDPGWREEDFRRVKDDAVNYLRVGLRGNNDEELGKEVLESAIYAGDYARYSVGSAGAIEQMTLEDVKGFYRSHYTQPNLILGIAGGYPAAFLEAMKKDFGKLPATGAATPPISAPAEITANRMVIVDKDTRSVAFSLGFPIDVKRGHPDYPALLVAQSYFGQHRISGGRLYDRMREARGLNYGNYAYIEYFPRGMFLFEPNPNLARSRQLFTIWIRPVEPPTAKFALRLALYELDKLCREGIPQDAFERSRDFLSKYVNILTATKSAELGYLIDSLYYGIPPYNGYLKSALAKLTRDDVNRAIKRHLRADRLVIAAVSKDAAALKADLVSDDASPMTYNSPKAEEIVTEDKVVEKFPLNLASRYVLIISAAKVFE